MRRILNTAIAVVSTLTCLLAIAAPAVASPTSSHPPSAVSRVEVRVDSPITSDSKPNLQVGFNGTTHQIAQIGNFYRPGESRLCQLYVGWSVAVQADGQWLHPGGWEGTRAWLANAQKNGCNEILVSFKAMSSQDPPEEFDPEPPTVEEYTSAFRNFVTTDWTQVAGYTGTFVFAPWNEPNLNSGPGSGYPQPPDRRFAIEPRLAARYYLAATSVCQSEGCRVVAMNFGSNGRTGEADHLTNCAVAEVPRDVLCQRRSRYAAPNAEPSYLDYYRNEIANAASEFGLPSRYRPPLVAYHGWADSNSYLRGERTCNNYRDCLLEKVLYAYRGSWGGSEIWNTEDGIGQPGFFTHDQITDQVHAEGIAYTMRLASRSPRYTRLYWTHMVGSPSRLLITEGDRVVRKRPGLCVLQGRSLAYDRTACPDRPA